MKGTLLRPKLVIEGMTNQEATQVVKSIEYLGYDTDKIAQYKAVVNKDEHCIDVVTLKDKFVCAVFEYAGVYETPTKLLCSLILEGGYSPFSLGIETTMEEDV